MAESGFFSDARDAAQAVVKILAGRELGVSDATGEGLEQRDKQQAQSSQILVA